MTRDVEHLVKRCCCKTTGYIRRVNGREDQHHRIVEEGNHSRNLLIDSAMSVA